MFIINCPFCGERDQSEFSSGGEAHIVRPKQPAELSDDEWAEYLFMRKNIKGCLLYTSPSPRDPKTSRMPSSA